MTYTVKKIRQWRDAPTTLRTATLMILFLVAPICHAAGLQPATSTPTRFAWYSDPQTLYVRPGNAGALLFNDTVTSPPSNLHPWQDEYCNAAWIDLDSPTYTARITAQVDEQSTESYWTRLYSWMTSMAYAGAAPFWIIDDDFLARCMATPALVDQLTSQIERFAQADIPPPALVFQPSTWTIDTARLFEQLQEKFPGMIGAHFTAENQSQLPPRGWDFIIFDAALIPEAYRGQAAAHWLHSRYGAAPVILSPTDYDFLRDITWIACGAAGVWYPPLPTAPAANHAAAVHLRASTTFLNRFPGTWLALSPRPTHPAFDFNLENPGHAWAAVIPSTADPITMPTPAGLEGQLVGADWYNPATDQTIIQPLTRLPSTISVQRPDANLWIYTLSVAPPPAENAHHVAPIRDWPR